MTPKVVFAITGHGYGHATRSLLVLRELMAAAPGVEVTVSTALPEEAFRDRIPPSVVWVSRRYEPGTAQKGILDVDPAATRELYRRHLRERPALLEDEIRFLRSGRFTGVVADIPALPFAAARAVGIPACGLWNFTWDWILEPILWSGEASAEDQSSDGELASIPRLLREDYASASLHLRLPFGPRDSPLPRVEDIPLVARKATLERADVFRKVGLDPSDSRPVVLVAMGGWACESWDRIEVKGCRDFRFMVLGDVPFTASSQVVRATGKLGVDYDSPDLVAAADAVLSKPGYGIASECAVHRTPLLGVKREGFLEVPELIRGFSALGPFEEMPRHEFFQGSWEPHIQRLLDRPLHWHDVAKDGARVAAARLAKLFEPAGSGR
jgi:L-arabinokinase